MNQNFPTPISLLPAHFVRSEQTLARAAASLQAEIEEELALPDPTPEKAKALLSRTPIGVDGANS